MQKKEKEVRDKKDHDISRLRAIARKYRFKYRVLLDVLKGGKVVALDDVECLDIIYNKRSPENDGISRLRGYQCLFNKCVELFVPDDVVDVGSDIKEEGDVGTLVVDALWALRKGLWEVPDEE